MRRLLVVVVLAVLAVGAVSVLERDLGQRATEPAGPSAEPGATPSSGGEAARERRPPRPGRACRTTAAPFEPVTVDVPGVVRGAGVLALPRDAAGVVGVPPTTAAGSTVFGWDAPGTRPGSAAGHVVLVAHTWPDGSALGNRLLAGLRRGGRLVLEGATGQRACYDVVRREEVTADTLVPELTRTDGPHRLVVVVCSGTRRGPGDWTHRTLWTAEPA